MVQNDPDKPLEPPQEVHVAQTSPPDPADTAGVLKALYVHCGVTVPEQELTPAVSTAIVRLMTRVLKLKALSDTDELTGLKNLRAFRGEIEKLLGKIRKRLAQISKGERQADDKYPKATVVFIDINNFKKINDTVGRGAGDEALKHIAQILLTHKRDSDFVARLGGDEFVILMETTKPEEAQEYARRIAADIEAKPCRYVNPDREKNPQQEAQLISLSAAFGFHAVDPNDTPEMIIDLSYNRMKWDKEAQKFERRARDGLFTLDKIPGNVSLPPHVPAGSFTSRITSPAGDFTTGVQEERTETPGQKSPGPK